MTESDAKMRQNLSQDDVLRLLKDPSGENRKEAAVKIAATYSAEDLTPEERVIAEDNPTMFGGDPDIFAARLAYEARDIETELQLIEAMRRHVASILRSLPPEAFERSGTHSVEGSMTLRTLLERITNHVPHHVRFIEEKRAAIA